MARKRLIGFKTVVSDYDRGRRSIRAICPIIDEIDCSKSHYYEGNLDDMEAIIGGDPVTQTLTIDTYSQWYGAADGYSFCSGYYDMELSGPIPQWMSVTNAVTIGAASPQHEEDSFDLTVTIKRDG